MRCCKILYRPPGWRPCFKISRVVHLKNGVVGCAGDFSESIETLLNRFGTESWRKKETENKVLLFLLWFISHSRRREEQEVRRTWKIIRKLCSFNNGSGFPFPLTWIMITWTLWHINYAVKKVTWILFSLLNTIPSVTISDCDTHKRVDIHAILNICLI